MKTQTIAFVMNDKNEGWIIKQDTYKKTILNSVNWFYRLLIKVF